MEEILHQSIWIYVAEALVNPGDSSYQLVWDFFHQQESQEIFAHKQPHPSCFKPHNLNYRYWWILMNIILFSLFGPSIGYTANVYGKRYCISQLPFCECDVPDPIFPCRERTELIGLYQEETNCCSSKQLTCVFVSPKCPTHHSQSWQPSRKTRSLGWGKIPWKKTYRHCRFQRSFGIDSGLGKADM